uniref:Uncharacterized protein n=1 Tax=Seriola lalandi dorsalis TaxID=1841481 RepID=A0A3B4Y0U0_SERLL
LSSQLNRSLSGGTWFLCDHDEYRPPVWKSYCKYQWNIVLLS